MLKRFLIVLLTLGLGVYTPVKPIDADFQISEHELNKAADLLKKLIAAGHSHEEIVGMMQNAMEQGDQEGTVLVSPAPKDAQKKFKKYYIIGAGIGLATVALLAGGYYAYNYYEQQKKDEAARLENEKIVKLQEAEIARLQEEKQKQDEPKDNSLDKQDIVEVIVGKIENIGEMINDNIGSFTATEETVKKKHRHKHKHHKKDNNQPQTETAPDVVQAEEVSNNVSEEQVEALGALTKISEKGVIKEKAKHLFGKIQSILN